MIFNRFARSARSCVESAVEEARSLGHDSISDEDLLLGVLESDMTGTWPRRYSRSA
jgi:hypothetical protein